MEPTFPYSPGSTQDTDRFTNYTPPRARCGDGPRRHGGRHWMHLLMCAPMLLVVGYLVLTGRGGGGSIFYALGCMAMMGVMVAMMNHGSGDQGSGTRTPGHRH